jgi:hypothetical protein
MNKWSNDSKEILNQLHPILRLLMNRVLQVVDVKLIDGLRDHVRQMEYMTEGKTKVAWPLSCHNRTSDESLERFEYDLSDAVDVAPWPSLYSDREQMIYLAGVITGVAAEIGIKIRIGADWNGDGVLNNKKNDFFDSHHIELVH